MDFLAARTRERCPDPTFRKKVIHFGLRELRSLRIATGSSLVQVHDLPKKNDGRGA